MNALPLAIFNDPNLSVAVAYNDEPIRAVRVSASVDFKFITGLRSDATIFKISAADVPNPQPGDELTVVLTGEIFTVQGVPTRIMNGAGWKIEAVPA